MSGKEIEALIDVVISYIPLIYPGIISVFIYNFCNAVSSKDISLFFLKSICIGYLYDVFLHKLSVDKTGNELWYNAVLCALAIVMPIIVYKMVKSELLCNILALYNINTSLIDNDIEEMCTGDTYNYLRIYDKNNPIVYEGYVRTFEKDANKRQYIILTDYKISYYNTENYKETKIREFKGDANDKIIVYKEDIRMMEKQSYKRIEGIQPSEDVEEKK